MKIRGFFALLLTGLLAAVAAFAGQPVAELYDKAEYRIAMRDSVALYTAVYTPKAPGEAPVIMRERQGGVSSIHSFKSAYYMIKVSLALIIDRLSIRKVKGGRA